MVAGWCRETPDSVCISVWCRLEDTEQEMIEQRAELQREQSVGESGRERGVANYTC